jgi:uncharacterized repeat protein (TIGR01451 family)
VKNLRFLLGLLLLSLSHQALAAPPTISKSFDDASILVGGTTTLRFTITLDSSLGNTNVAFTDNLPAGLVVASVPAATSTCFGTFTPVPGSGSVSLSGATPPRNALCFLSVAVTGVTVGTKNNVSDPITSAQGTGNTASASLDVLPAADLAVTKMGPVSVLASDLITYTITVTNTGPEPSTGVSLSDVLPPGTTFTSVTAPAGWSVTTPPVGGTGTVTATIATLANGASGTFTLVVTAPAAPGAVTNTASVTSGTADPDSTDDSAFAVTSVLAQQADLAVSKTGPSNVLTSGAIAYTVVVTNAGPQPAASVSMSDVLPPGTTFTSVTAPAGWSVTTPAVGGTGTVTATIPTLASGASGTFTLNVTAPAAPGVVSNTATASASTADPSTGNNSAMATTTTAFGTAALSLSKVGLQSGGSNISWSINVLNAGPDAASSVVVTDVLPAGTTFVSATPSQGTCSGTTTVTCAIGTIPSGGSAAISLVTSSTATIGAVTNTATVAAAQADPNPSDNSATTTVSLVSNTFTGPTATGSGTATASFTGGGATCTFTRAAFIPVTGGAGSPPAPPPGEWAFPHGLFDFALGNCTPGLTTTFTIVYPQPVVGAVYWKYGPTGFDPSPHWYQLPATFTGNTVTFTITDGGLGDDDLSINGLIVDQGGPGIPIVPAGSTQTPTLSEWALMLLAAMMLLVGLAGARRRRA